MHTSLLREELPGDEDNYNNSLCFDNFFNKAAGGWTPTLAGDHLMAAIQWNDIMVMALLYKEEINKLLGKREENEIIKRLASGGGLLSPSQRKKLEAEQRDNHFLQALKPILQVFSKEDTSLASLPPPKVEDSLKPLPPPPQPALSVVPNPVTAQGNDPILPIPKSIVGDNPTRYQVVSPQVFSSRRPR
jgi:hypothetical protein